MLLLASKADMEKNPRYAEFVGQICEESCEKIQLVADILLLRSGCLGSLDKNRCSVLEPVSTVGESYAKLRDVIVADTKVLAIAVKDFGQQMNLRSLNDIRKSCDKITDLVIRITEAATSAAYYSSMLDVQCKPAKRGVVDYYSFERAKQQLHMSCRKFTPENSYPLDNDQLLNISKSIADSLAVLTRGCTLASESKEINPIDQEQLRNCSQSLQGSTGAFLSALKAFASAHSDEHQRNCWLFSKPLIATVDCIVEFSSKFAGTPAILTEKGHDAQTNILGGAMAVSSSCTQLLGIAKVILNDNKHNVSSNWQKLVSSIKAVGDSTKLLSSAIRQHTPYPSRRPSVN